MDVSFQLVREVTAEYEVKRKALVVVAVCWC